MKISYPDPKKSLIVFPYTLGTPNIKIILFKILYCFTFIFTSSSQKTMISYDILYYLIINSVFNFKIFPIDK